MADDELTGAPPGDELPDEYVEPEPDETPEEPEPEDGGDAPEDGETGEDEAEEPQPGTLEFKRIQDAQNAFHRTREENAELRRRLEALEQRTETPTEDTKAPTSGQAYILSLFNDEEIRQAAYPATELRVDELQAQAREALENLGYDEEEVVKRLQERVPRHWRMAWNEKLPEAGKAIEAQRVATREREATELPTRLRAEVAAYADDTVTAEELAEAMASEPEFARTFLAATPAKREVVATGIADMIAGRKLRQGKLTAGTTPAVRADPTPAPNTGPNSSRTTGVSNPVIAQRIKDFRKRVGSAAADLTDAEIARDLNMRT